MSRFKIGDKVQAIYGYIGEVVDIQPDRVFPIIVQFKGYSDPYAYSYEGQYYNDRQSSLDITKITEQTTHKVNTNPAVKETNPKSLASSNKAPMAVVPANVLMEISVALMEGALKYGRHNYRASGVKASEYYSATLRHLMYWWEGEDADADSLGLSHITKAISSLIVIRDAMMRDQLNDDRPPKSGMPDFQEHIKKLKEKYKDFDPKHYTELNKNEQE